MKQLLIAVPLLLAACATKGEMLSLPSDAGTKAVYKAPFEKVRLAAQDTSGELDFEIKPKETTTTDAEVRFLSSQGISSGTSGRYLRVRVVKGEGDEVTVFAVIRSKTESSEARMTDDLIEKDFHKKVAARLEKK